MAVEEIQVEMVSSVWKVLVAPGEPVAADLIATVVDG